MAAKENNIDDIVKELEELEKSNEEFDNSWILILLAILLMFSHEPEKKIEIKV